MTAVLENLWQAAAMMRQEIGKQCQAWTTCRLFDFFRFGEVGNEFVEARCIVTFCLDTWYWPFTAICDTQGLSIIARLPLSTRFTPHVCVLRCRGARKLDRHRDGSVAEGHGSHRGRHRCREVAPSARVWTIQGDSARRWFPVPGPGGGQNLCQIAYDHRSERWSGAKVQWDESTDQDSGADGWYRVVL